MKRVLISVVGCAVGVVLAAVILTVPLASAGERFDFDWRGSESAQAQTTAGDAISIDQARDAALAYLSGHELANLTTGEIIEFSNHFYVVVTNSTTGEGALELIVSRNGEFVHPVPGPGIRWNTDYDLLAPVHDMMMERIEEHQQMHESMGDGDRHAWDHMMEHGREFHERMHERMGDMSGMQDMGHGMMIGDRHHRPGMGYEPGSTTVLDTPLTEDQARDAAQGWLNENRENTTATTVTAFPGYLTFHVERDGELAGLISVNPSTGAVWAHVWNGDTVAGTED